MRNWGGFFKRDRFGFVIHDSARQEEQFFFKLNLYFLCISLVMKLKILVLKSGVLKSVNYIIKFQLKNSVCNFQGAFYKN